MRRIICIFLLMFLPLHAFAVQGGWLSAENVFDIAHEMEHRDGKSHHHSDDGSVHYDESGESAKHFSEHSASQPALGLPGAFLPPHRLEMLAGVATRPTQTIPDPIPERPQRPPSFLG